jgi:predicted dinucleotide-binding enzyme
MKIGILGSGEVAQALGAGFLKHGHAVTLGTRSPEKLAAWKAKHAGGQVGSFADAGNFGEVLVLAVKGEVAAKALHAAGEFAGKVVIDATNPIAAKPPQNGVLSFYTSGDDSQLERLQREFPQARLVKAFNSVGSADMVDPQFAGGKPSMFICGADANAKATVRGILDQFGWETEDMGGVEAARVIEPLAILWCIPGFLRDDWRHAFKVLR